MLEAVTIGNDGIVTSKRVTRFVNLTTIGSKLTKRLADHLLKANITYIDSPVSGTPKQAENGSLIVMTACADDDFKLVEPLLKELGQVFHVGQSAGLAQTMSLVRAMVSVSELLINSEATTMSAQSDLDRSLMLALGNHPNDSDNIQKLAASMLTKKLDSGPHAGNDLQRFAASQRRDGNSWNEPFTCPCSWRTVARRLS